ncbi:hypothetical protein CTheo_5210 [Ceratobasidium theobromae]|uniref:Uncharacterized protein n=1 Tax=Ceratobasidium theobromae TaxID=1582974 RepID=A0A5N5QJ67_9AGAM|nr:hypothetical protein CTheo_5210 [Ceratobasidium theobromae]
MSKNPLTPTGHIPTSRLQRIQGQMTARPIAQTPPKWYDHASLVTSALAAINGTGNEASRADQKETPKWPEWVSAATKECTHHVSVRDPRGDWRNQSTRPIGRYIA